MFSKGVYVIIYFAVALVSRQACWAGEEISEAEKQSPRLLLVGDSTMCKYKADSNIRGWGEFLPPFLEDNLMLLNHAVGGSSTKSFLAKGLWERALAEKPDYVFIQFGQNDRITREDTHAEAETTFRENLKLMIREARAANAQPVLLTPVANRIFREGELTNRGILPWVEAVRIVAEQENVPLLDHHALIFKLYRELGEAGSSDLTTDKTHFTEKGASIAAELVAKELPAKVPELTPHLQKSR
jgi:lysophospholipase L1-like esterase